MFYECMKVFDFLKVENLQNIILNSHIATYEWYKKCLRYLMICFRMHSINFAMFVIQYFMSVIILQLQPVFIIEWDVICTSHFMVSKSLFIQLFSIWYYPIQYFYFDNMQTKVSIQSNIAGIRAHINTTSVGYNKQQ